MMFDWGKFKNFVVETRSGVRLGKIKGFIFDTDGQLIHQYKVGGGLSKQILINREQVVRFEDGKMIVDDAIKKSKIMSSQNISKIKTSSESVVMSEKS